MKNPDFRSHFLRPGPGGADSYRAAMGEAVEALAGLYEQLGAPYSGLDVESLDALLAAELADSALAGPLSGSIAKSVDLVARHSIIVQHPRCIAHLHTPPVIPALAAEVVLTALNQSMDSWDQASAATHVETQVIDWFGRKFGLGPDADGTFTSGGTQSNYMGMLLARDEVCGRVFGQDVFENGLPGDASRLRVLASETSHFSIVKSMAQLGLGSRCVVPVAVDEAGRMKPEALEAALRDLDQQLLVPMAIVATAGTTDGGSIDPIDTIADICRTRGIWLHIDAAFGGALILTGQASRLAGIERADSIALDFHKFFFQPISCGLFLLRERKHFSLLEHHADYLNRETDPRPNLVEKSVATSKRFDALKIWLTLKSIGPAVLGQMVEHVLELTRHAAGRVTNTPKLELLAEPQLSTVLFRFVPGDAGQTDELNRRLHEELLASGRAVIGRTARHGAVTLKLTLLNPCLTDTDLDELVELIASEGNRLETTLK